jgi:hypothetical protein
MRIELEERERAVLTTVLEELLGDVRDEIYRAESHDFKEQLKAKKDIVIGLLGKLRPVPAAVQGGG